MASLISRSISLRKPHGIDESLKSKTSVGTPSGNEAIIKSKMASFFMIVVDDLWTMVTEDAPSKQQSWQMSAEELPAPMTTTRFPLYEAAPWNLDA